MALIVGLSLTLVSCGPDDDPTLSVNGSASIEANGTVYGDITVTAENTDWSVEVTNGREWLTAYKNGNKITLSAKENQLKDERTASVVVTATANSALSQTVNVVQKGAAATITVNGTESTDISFTGVFDNKSGIDFKQTIKVVSNVDWNISGKPDWLNVSPSNGNGNVDLVIYPMSENSSSSSRSATITLNGGGRSATINVTQDAGKPVCYVDITDEVVLYDEMCWAYSPTGKVNKFYVLLISENEYSRLTDKELEEKLIKEEEMKIKDDYISLRWYDSNYNLIQDKSTYYVITLASDESGKYGELRKKKLSTPPFKDRTEDAWVDFENIKLSPNTSFSFDTKKEGYCNTYHVIYGALPSDQYFRRAVFAFEINYYLKHKKKHWLAENENWEMEIITDYPNNHTFVYYSNLVKYPRCFGYGWGVFKDGTLSSDIIGFQWDTSKESVIQKVPQKTMPKNGENKENITIRRSKIVKRTK